MRAQTGTRRRSARLACITATMALLAAACVGSSASAPPSVPSQPPTPSTSASIAASSPAAPVTAAPAAVTPTPKPTATGTPAASAWTTITWAPVTVTAAAKPAAEGVTHQVFGWSKGYVGFTLTPPKSTSASTLPTVVASYSSDGVHWKTGQTLDPKAAGSQALWVFRTVLEGPAGLVAVGWAGACGDEYVDSLWTSTDGIAWKPLSVGAAFGANPPEITHISGGAAGFVAVAYKGAGAWTSKDGRTWTRVNMKATAFKDALIDDGSAVSGGYVLGGTTGVPNCAVVIQDPSAKPTPTPVPRIASAWWSADGSTWTKEPLPDAHATSERQVVRTVRLTDHMVLLGDEILSANTSWWWGSTDGQTWKSLGLPADFLPESIVSSAQRALVVGIADPQQGTLSMRQLRTFNDDFTLADITPAGEVPDVGTLTCYDYGVIAIGPAGVVVTNADGSRMWFGAASE